MEYIFPLIAGFTLGFIHAFDVDHLVAVSAFASKRPQGIQATKFGILWGLGHTTTVLVLGLVSLAFKFVIPPLVESIAELVVGALLIAIGAWVLKDIVQRQHIHVHKHEHDGVEHVHFHSHKHSEDHQHRHSMFLVGATYGFAGTASILVILPITVTHSLFAAALYLVLFGVGTIVAMGVFAYLIGRISHSLNSDKALTVFQGVAGSVSICVGIVWIGGRLF